MSGAMSIHNPSKISKQRVIIIAVVLLAHLILIWAITYLVVPYHVYSPTQNQPITVRLMSIPEANRNDVTHGSAQQAAPKNIVQEEILKPPMSANTLPSKQSSEQEMVLSKQSEKNISRQPKAEVIEKKDNVPVQPVVRQSTKGMTQIETQNIRSLDDRQGQSEQGQHTTEQKDQSNSITQGRSGDVQGQDQTLNQSVQALSDQMKPIPVNRVDVLSFGKLSYSDKDLQQKNRLVILNILIDSKGNPVQVSIKQGSGMDYLDQMAIKAAEKSKFKAHRVNGQAVPVIVDFPIDLRLNQRRR